MHGLPGNSKTSPRDWQLHRHGAWRGHRHPLHSVYTDQSLVVMTVIVLVTSLLSRENQSIARFWTAGTRLDLDAGEKLIEARDKSRQGSYVIRFLITRLVSLVYRSIRLCMVNKAFVTCRKPIRTTHTCSMDPWGAQVVPCKQ